MSTLLDPDARADLVRRLKQLTPDSERRFGTMSPGGMLCHLSDSFDGCLGRKPHDRKISFLGRTLIRWVALHTKLRWRPGYPTLPEFAQEHGGTPPAEFEADRQRLIAGMEEFAEQACDDMVHPIFGRLSREEWGIWGWRHVDHHARQFGV